MSEILIEVILVPSVGLLGIIGGVFINIVYHFVDFTFRRKHFDSGAPEPINFQRDLSQIVAMSGSH